MPNDNKSNQQSPGQDSASDSSKAERPKENKNAAAYGRILVTVEVSLDQPWGSDWKIGEVFPRAKEAALRELEVRIQNTGMKIVGTKKVTAILVEER